MTKRPSISHPPIKRNPPRRPVQREAWTWRKFAHWLRGHPVVVILETMGLVGLIFAALLLIHELQDRKDERDARAWQLLTTKASGNSGKRVALEYLNSNQFCLPFGLALPWYGTCWKTAQDLRGINLEVSDEDGSGVYLVSLNLPDAKLARTNLTRARLKFANLQRIEVFSAKWDKVTFDGAIVTDSTLYKLSLKRSRNHGTSFNGSCLYKVNFTGADFWNEEVAKPQRAQFQKSELYKSDFTNADLRGADFSGAKLINIDFSGANLSDIVVDENTQTEGLWAYSSNAPKNIPEGLNIALISPLAHTNPGKKIWPSGYEVPPKCNFDEPS